MRVVGAGFWSRCSGQNPIRLAWPLGDSYPNAQAQLDPFHCGGAWGLMGGRGRLSPSVALHSPNVPNPSSTSSRQKTSADRQSLATCGNSCVRHDATMARDPDIWASLGLSSPVASVAGLTRSNWRRHRRPRQTSKTTHCPPSKPQGHLSESLIGLSPSLPWPSSSQRCSVHQDVLNLYDVNPIPPRQHKRSPRHNDDGFGRNPTG
ncbi:hypothetical protein F4808DRAFT_186241 [Astrocystis sublimbata]|nr:hypothetical protein F4808DRAFT_186241 [Astrocystis sublimbata]